ncbi:TetR/AcrR family transcriptional regulator [Salana multivorans]|uniref:TetR/AcrR family transcriptional regulator n=1 Tax=Salana multivorans TaxID=120377 RepID=UPI000AA7C288|nr:TetR/AcrR family transcriptional regulator [Salana multivorans]
MDTPRRAGRPRAASREILEEAACELFLEQGYDATSVADITSRAGVSRSTFFNYVESKSDLLWARFDDGVERLRATLARLREEVADGGRGDDVGLGGDVATGGDVASREAQARAALATLAADLPPENVALAYTQAGAMGLGEDLRLAEARRLVAVRDALAVHLRTAVSDQLAAQVRATALAGALLAAVREWSLAGVGRPALPAVLARALDCLGPGAATGLDAGTRC